jgi:hypothetical protein
LSLKGEVLQEELPSFQSSNKVPLWIQDAEETERNQQKQWQASIRRTAKFIACFLACASITILTNAIGWKYHIAETMVSLMAIKTAEFGDLTE